MTGVDDRTPAGDSGGISDLRDAVPRLDHAVIGNGRILALMCSFWWAEALALAGKLGDASAVFERAVRHANQLGLFSKNVDDETRHPLGNFPHIEAHSLINAAITIGAFLDADGGRMRAWS